MPQQQPSAERGLARLGLCIGLILAGIYAWWFAPVSNNPERLGMLVLLAVAWLVLGPICAFTGELAQIALRNTRLLPGMRFLWGGLSVVFALIVVSHAVGNRAAARRFDREGRTTPGEVLEVHPEDHNRFLVRFEIAGVKYRKLMPGPALDSIKGPSPSTITVFYYASDPDQCFLTKPEFDTALDVACFIAFGGALPVWLVALVSSALLRHRSANTGGHSPEPTTPRQRSPKSPNGP